MVVWPKPVVALFVFRVNKVIGVFLFSPPPPFIY